MRRSAVYALAMGVAVGGFCPNVAASSPEAQAFRQEVQAAREQHRAAVQAKRAQIRELRAKIQTLKAQAKGTTDLAAKQQLRAQIKGLREQVCELMKGNAQNRVAWTEQGIGYAQRRAERAREHLAKIEAREAKME